MTQRKTMTGVATITPLIHVHIGHESFSGGGERVVVDASIPGRDGELWRTWPMRGGVVAQATLDDLTAWVAQTVQNGMCRYFPRQGLPG